MHTQTAGVCNYEEAEPSVRGVHSDFDFKKHTIFSKRRLSDDSSEILGTFGDITVMPRLLNGDGDGATDQVNCSGDGKVWGGDTQLCADDLELHLLDVFDDGDRPGKTWPDTFVGERGNLYTPPPSSDDAASLSNTPARGTRAKRDGPERAVHERMEPRNVRPRVKSDEGCAFASVGELDNEFDFLVCRQALKEASAASDLGGSDSGSLPFSSTGASGGASGIAGVAAGWAVWPFSASSSVHGEHRAATDWMYGNNGKFRVRVRSNDDPIWAARLMATSPATALPPVSRPSFNRIPGFAAACVFALPWFASKDQKMPQALVTVASLLTALNAAVTAGEDDHDAKDRCHAIALVHCALARNKIAFSPFEESREAARPLSSSSTQKIPDFAKLALAKLQDVARLYHGHSVTSAMTELLTVLLDALFTTTATIAPTAESATLIRLVAHSLAVVFPSFSVVTTDTTPKAAPVDTPSASIKSSPADLALAEAVWKTFHDSNMLQAATASDIAAVASALARARDLLSVMAFVAPTNVVAGKNAQRHAIAQATIVGFVRCLTAPSQAWNGLYDADRELARRVAQFALPNATVRSLRFEGTTVSYDGPLLHDTAAFAQPYAFGLGGTAAQRTHERVAFSRMVASIEASMTRQQPRGASKLVLPQLSLQIAYGVAREFAAAFDDGSVELKPLVVACVTRWTSFILQEFVRAQTAVCGGRS